MLASRHSPCGASIVGLSRTSTWTRRFWRSGSTCSCRGWVACGRLGLGPPRMPGCTSACSAAWRPRCCCCCRAGSTRGPSRRRETSRCTRWRPSIRLPSVRRDPDARARSHLPAPSFLGILPGMVATLSIAATRRQIIKYMLTGRCAVLCLQANGVLAYFVTLGLLALGWRCAYCSISYIQTYQSLDENGVVFVQWCPDASVIR